MFRAHEKYVKTYRFLAFTTFNVVVLIVLLNLALEVIFRARDRFLSGGTSVDSRVSSYREKFADLQAYARISATTANQYLDEQDAMGSLGFQYEPWVEFGHLEFRGTLLNTDSRGFRKTREPRRPGGKAIKVYVFGGSTTFGYGVPDDYTIPSYMQAILEQRYPAKSISVRNYGQGYYYSSQEMLLLISLLKSGDIPDYAVFIDGGNDTASLGRQIDEPYFTPTVRQLWDAQRGVFNLKISGELSWIPMVRLANGLSRRLFAENGATREIPAMWPTDRRVDYVVSRYTSNQRIIRAVCVEYGVRCYFVWQPNPGYKYNRTLHRKFPFEGDVPEYIVGVFSQMEKYNAPDFLYLGNMLQDVSEKVFVDNVHYNEVLNEQIAGRICELLVVD